MLRRARSNICICFVLFAVPASANISPVGLLDHFDPNRDLTIDQQGHVSGWINQADPVRSVTVTSTATAIVNGPEGRPLIRFDAPENNGHLSYPAPSPDRVTPGITLFVVFRLYAEVAEWHPFPRIWVCEPDDTPSLFLRQTTGDLEMKANPIPILERMAAPYDGIYDAGELVILTVRLRPESQEMYINGHLVQTGSTVVPTYDFTATHIRIGNSLKGDIGTVLVYDQSASLVDLEQTGQALARTYGVDWNPLVTFAPMVPPLRRIIAHRGNSSRAPENTLAAITAAAGFAGMTEFDIRVSADGHLVTMHDSTVDRTTNGSALVENLDYEGGMDQLDAGSWFADTFTGEPIPTMAESIQHALAQGMIPQIERKEGPAEAYAQALSDLGILDQVHVISFDWGFIAELRALCPELPIGALGRNQLTQSRIDEVKAAGASYIGWRNSNITEQEVRLVHENGLRLAVWTVNETARMQELLEMGVDAVVTDYPEDLHAIVQGLGYAGWASDPAQELPSYLRDFYADPEMNGLSNGILHVLGGSPAHPPTQSLFTSNGDMQNNLTFQHTLNNALAHDVQHGYEWSTDLITWYAADETNETGITVAIDATVIEDRLFPQVDDIRVSAQIIEGHTSTLFVRLFARLIQAPD